MKKIAIISSSIRIGRQSHRVALYFEKYLKDNNLAEPFIIDLKDYDFPVFEERLKFIENPTESMLKLANDVKSADGIIIVTPEYNGGYPASLKNIIDLLYDEWKRKPIGLAAVSAGAFAGTQVVTSLLFSLWKIGALVVPSSFHVPTVSKSYSEDGQPLDRETTDKKARVFTDELLHWTNI